MNTKMIICLVAGTLLSTASFAEAQQSGKIPRIGILMSASASNTTRRVQALQQGLHQLGYVEGKNIIIEYRYAEGKLEPLTDFADELVRLKFDVIVADTSVVTEAAKNATKTIPIVFTARPTIHLGTVRWQAWRDLVEISPGFRYSPQS